MTSRTGDKVDRDSVVVPETNVTAYEALFGRRSAWKLKNEPVPREVLDRMFSTTVWAPNHKITEPWRFFILEKDSDVRKAVAEVAYQYMMDETGEEARAAPYRGKIMDPPLVVYVYHTPGKDESDTKEHYAATCMAVQNLALAGFVEGVSVTFETGRVIRSDKLSATLGAEPNWLMVMMITIGYPDERPASSRTPASKFTVWE
jgi:nitroreductase